MKFGSLSLCIAVMTSAVASAQERNTGTLVPGAETSTMVSGLSPVREVPKGPTYSKAQIDDINAARATMRAYTACLVASADTSFERTALMNFLRVPPQAPDAQRLEKKTEKPECLPTSGADYISVRLTSDLARGGIMRALYLETRRTPPRFRVRPEDIAGVTTAGNATFDLLHRFGACIVARQRGDAERFLTSKVGSSEEGMAIRALAPTLNGCLEKGLSVHFSYGMLESVIAEALFDQSSAVPTIVASKVPR